MVSDPVPALGPLAFRGGLYGKISALLSIVAVSAYSLERLHGPPNGGTWIGYMLGTVAALMILWLAWFGIRKRQYGRSRVPLQDWLSAHVCLGLAVLVLGTLHTGFRFNLTVHTFSYVAMVAVILSGMFGVFAYARLPGPMTSNRSGTTLEQMVAEIAKLDVDARDYAAQFDDRTAGLVFDATCILPAPIGWREVVFGIDRRQVIPDATQRAIDWTASLLMGEEARLIDEVTPMLSLLTRRVTLLDRCRRDARYRLLLTAWRVVHVPLTIGLLASLAIHIAAVLYY